MAAEQRLPGRRRAVLHVVAVGDGHEIEQSAAIKTSTSETLVVAGGTITHHRAVGQTHLPAIGIRSESGLALLIALPVRVAMILAGRRALRD